MVYLKKEIPKANIIYFMNNQPDLMQTVKRIVEENGKAAVKNAHEEILSLKHTGEVIYSALEYFAETILHSSLPVFPALLSLSCKAVGGKTEKTTSIGAAMTLVAIAADVHDDIIDDSPTKYGKKTIVGQFGSDVALLAGDALLFYGLALLNRECGSLLKQQREAIIGMTSKAFCDISNAEANETGLRKKHDLAPEEYFEIIRQKAVVPEVHCKIGGVLGNADEATLDALGRYGQAFGVASIIRDEFIDLVEQPELLSRMNHGYPPFPILYALRNKKIKPKVEKLIDNSRITEKLVNEIVDLILDSAEVQELRKDFSLEINRGLQALTLVKNVAIARDLRILLTAMADGL